MGAFFDKSAGVFWAAAQTHLDFYIRTLQVDTQLASLSSSIPNVGTPLTVIGFGQTSEGGPNSQSLQEGIVNVFPISTCADIFQDLNPIDPTSMLCAIGSGVDT